MHNILGEGKTVLNVFYWCYEMSGWLSFVFAGPTLLLSKTLLRRSKNNNISGKKTFFLWKKEIDFLNRKNCNGASDYSVIVGPGCAVTFTEREEGGSVTVT